MPSGTDESVAEVNECGRVTIPDELRTELGIDDVDAARFCLEEGEVILHPVELATDLQGILAEKTDDEERSALELLRASRSTESKSLSED